MAIVLVTGANRGIGLELCRALDARGDSVVAVCRTPSPSLVRLGVRVESGVDVSDAAKVDALGRALEGTTLDVIINNAGMLGYDALGSIDYDSIRSQFEANAIGPLRVTERLLPLVPAGGKIVLITSRMGSIADNTSGSMYGYRMSKAALNMAGSSLARDLKPRGIAVAVLHPGYVRTAMTGNQGSIDAHVAASSLLERIDELRLETTGHFLHANGETLPW